MNVRSLNRIPRAARVLSLRKFIVDFESLPRSMSHRVWAESFGLDEHDRLAVNTKEGRAFLIDPRNGKLIQDQLDAHRPCPNNR